MPLFTRMANSILTEIMLYLISPVRRGSYTFPIRMETFMFLPIMPEGIISGRKDKKKCVDEIGAFFDIDTDIFNSPQG